ncbi:MAG: dTDP-4-dehydrorhamnose reductase [Pseudomonadales bacterium]|nr:dTDP-4-dehydrorhamnose reductase [Pseudomonadales bacterium]
MHVLILGKNGQVGKALAQYFPKATLWDRNSLDLSNTSSIDNSLTKLNPDCIINAAAYTAVDKAESEPELAHLINEVAVNALAQYANKHKILLIHFSTDYVFSGNSNTPYAEDDPTSPTGIYGQSKLAGELAITTICDRYFIFRTSWVFAEDGGNFVNTMLRLGSERAQLGVVNDQFGCPTYAGDIAHTVHTIVQSEISGEYKAALNSGIYHLCCRGAVSWYEFAKEIFRRAYQAGLIQKIPEVKALTTTEYPTDAERPANSVLNTSKLEQALRHNLPHWSVGLDRLLESYSGTNNGKK